MMSQDEKESIATLKCIPLVLSKEERDELIRIIEAPAEEPNQALKDAYQLYLKTVKSSSNTPNNAKEKY